MNVFRFGAQTVQQNQSMAQQGIASGAFTGGAPADDGLHGRTGQYSFKSSFFYFLQ